MLRVKIAIMRKARLTKNWGRVRGVIQKMLQRTRTVREASRWPKRRRAVMQDAVECMKREAAGMRGNNRGGPGVTRRTVANLLHATVIGAVLWLELRGLPLYTNSLDPPSTHTYAMEDALFFSIPRLFL